MLCEFKGYFSGKDLEKASLIIVSLLPLSRLDAELTLLQWLDGPNLICRGFFWGTEGGLRFTLSA